AAAGSSAVDHAVADGSGRAATRPKVGLVVIGNGAGIFLRCMSGVLEHFDPDRLELVVVCSAGTRNSLAPHLQNPRLGWHILPDEFSQMVPALAAGRFDVLYHWEVGSGPQNYFLPFFGAAPVQCTGWGLPDTTGIPQLEYYLTSTSVEPPGAQTQYSEQLCFSDQLLTWQSRIPAPETPATREEFGISSWQTLYVCAQHVRKLHPDFDEMLAGVLRLDPEGVCLLVQDRTGYGANRVQQRMARTIPDVAGRVRWLPRLTVDQYRRLISTADVLLDTPHFGGGLTTFDAFSLGIPVITLPGTFRRSRYASACYRLMGLDCGIADNLQEYVTLAVALGRNRDIRESVSRSILARSDVLFENRQVVREFERIFCELAARKPGPA
ncbi:MAG: hypothetical protein KDA79_04320, partial [Planctomycetaceae bacterium]|nr:hypothetical protein [Planctomycetaceae bacterium]